MIGIASTCVPLLLAVLPQEPASPAPVAATPAIGEARYATIVDVPVPDDVVLEVGGIAERDRRVFGFARARGLPVAVVMGGGYCPDIERIVDIHFGTVRQARDHATAHGVPPRRST